MLEQLLDRRHLTDGRPHPFPATSKGYAVVTQVCQLYFGFVV